MFRPMNLQERLVNVAEKRCAEGKATYDNARLSGCIAVKNNQTTLSRVGTQIY
jgi:hypothetical protein